METKTICPTRTSTILACKSIARAFKENIYELGRIRNDWDPAYATSLKIWIDDTIEKYYENTNGVLRENKFREWHEIMIGALKYLGILRASVKVDFKDEKEFVKDFFKQHGYDDFFSDAKNGDHLSIYNLLRTFTNNITPETREIIESKGTEKSVIDHILDFAEQVNSHKECIDLMESNDGVNRYGEKEIEEIYTAIKDICRICVAYYQYDPQIRDKFNFYRVLRNL
ncbi:MAG: hypothetical protein JXR31_16260 [Prolixibacteraceae bacterium]|nr:hypothetical protein [Prolixibacteraceae bacterium]